MRLNQIIDQYVSQVPKTVEGNRYPSGQQVYDHFKARNQYTDIEVYNNLRFRRLINSVAQTQDQVDWLFDIQQKINNLSQKMFDTKFPAAK